MPSTWKKFLDIDPSFWYNGVMKVGDLVLCTWQPSIRGVLDNTAKPTKHLIKGQYGIVTRVINSHRVAITFPGLCGYTHYLSPNAFEVLNESR